jgi:aspartate kinase/aspartokinase/homoserine dehydrogenase 1
MSEMKKIVVKFGGSNLKETRDIERLIEVIQFYNRPLVIVVSAFYGVTNMLIDIMNKARNDEKDIYQFSQMLKEMNEKIISHYIHDEAKKQQLLNLLEDRYHELKRQLLGINYLGEVPQFIEDTVLSYGEKISALIISFILLHKGFNCEEVLPEEMKLLTDGESGNATVDFERSAATVAEKLRADKIFIVPGFYGITKEGRKNIFGRGGSDYSAAAIAKCIGAETLDIWKDVDGFQSADPKLVGQALSIPQLNYGEAAELAYFGAKILHPRTVEPLLDQHIPIRIFNINKIDPGIKPLTIVNDEVRASEHVVKSVTYSDDFCVIRFSGPGVGIKPGLMERITAKLGEDRINIKMVFNSNTFMNLYFSAADSDRAYNKLKDLPLSGLNKVELLKGWSIVAIVGCGMAEKPGIAARVFKSVADLGINVKAISGGASDICTYFVVEKADCETAVKAIHSEFFA